MTSARTLQYADGLSAPRSLTSCLATSACSASEIGGIGTPYVPRSHALPKSGPIRLITAPLFLAAKLEAFRGRGGGDYYASHDLEDVIALIDGRAELVGEITASTGELREFLTT